MKKKLILLFVTAILVTSAVAQSNNLFRTMQVKVKMDKKAEWEKKMPVFIKTHYPQVVYRVYEVTTGENTGSYFLSVGPMSYKDLDVPPIFPKGQAAEKIDGHALQALTESIEVDYYTNLELLSTKKPDRKIKYVQVNFVDIVVGSWTDVQTFLARIKEVRDKNKMQLDLNYFRPSNSGSVNSFVMLTYFERMEELDVNLKFDEMYDKEFGAGAWTRDRQNYYGHVVESRIELWSLRTDLSMLKSVSAN